MSEVSHDVVAQFMTSTDEKFCNNLQNPARYEFLVSIKNYTIKILESLSNSGVKNSRVSGQI